MPYRLGTFAFRLGISDSAWDYSPAHDRCQTIWAGGIVSPVGSLRGWGRHRSIRGDPADLWRVLMGMHDEQKALLDVKPRVCADQDIADATSRTQEQRLLGESIL